jgi:phosphohistidine phosphatase
MNAHWRELVLFRHGEAAPARAGASDFDRPLTPAGRQYAARAAAHLACEPNPPRLLLHSPAARAAATAALVAEALVLPATAVLQIEGLYLATPQRLAALLLEHAGEVACVAVVGHNPGLSELGTLLDPRLFGNVLDTAGYWRISRDLADDSGLR